ncbi:MAG: lipocalin family protein [Bacteroidales bacterium]
MIPLFQFCSSGKESLEVVKDIQLEEYQGTWYEIARLPNRFEKGLKCITATYKLREDGKITVINKGRKIDNPSELKRVEGWAKVPDKSEPGKLKVTFFWPFFGKYWILELDENYQNVLVGSPSRKYLWILSRNKEMEQPVYDKLIKKAKEKGFDTTKMIQPKHDCEI